MPYGQKADQPRPRIPLVVPLESRYGLTTTDAKLVNAFAEKDEAGEYEVYKRPGIGAYANTIGALVSNFIVCGQYVAQASSATYIGIAPILLTFTVDHWANNDNGFTMYVGGGTSRIGSGFNSAGIAVGYTNRAYATQVSATRVAVIYTGASDNSPGIITWDFITPAYVGITATSSVLSLVPGPVYLDNTTYVMDTGGTIWGSNLGDTTVWSYANFIQPNAIPGAGVALAKHMSYVVAFKTGSTELLYDAGNAVGSPLLPLPNAAFAWGCFNGDTVQDIENELFWLATSAQGTLFIAKLSNGQHVKVSTPGIDKVIQGSVGPFYSFSSKLLGHKFYGLTAVGSNYTLVLDVDEGIWYLWTDPAGNYWPWWAHVSYPVTTPVVTCLSIPQNFTNTVTASLSIFSFGSKTYTDVNTSSVPKVFIVDIYTPNYDSGSRKRDVINRMDFIGDQQPGILLSRWNDNDYAPGKWSQFRSVDMNQKRPTLTKNGTFRRRAWNFRWQNALPLRLEGVELDILHGES